MNKSYRPDRPVTSEKIRDAISRSLNVDGDAYKRVFRKRLIISKGTVRGYTYKLSNKPPRYRDILAISNPEDTKLVELYFVDDCKTAATSLGIEEILTSE